MKKAIMLLLALVLVLGLVGCGGSPTPEATVTPEPTPTQLSAFQTLCNYVLENGSETSSIIYSYYDSKVLMVTREAMQGMKVSALVIESSDSFDSTIMFDITVEPFAGQGEGTFTIVYIEGAETYTFTYNKLAGESVSGGGKINPQTYEVAVDSFDNTTEEGLRSALLLFLKMALPELNTLFDETGLALTYEDFGFSKKILDMDIEIEVPEPTPLPLSIKINKLDFNRVGTPEAHIQFTNTGDKDIIAFDFYVKCYDAYGEVVKGYGRYDYYAGTYDTELASGKSSPSDWYWDLFGFDNVKTFEVAICKYKLEGEDAVEISNSQLEWIKMN